MTESKVDQLKRDIGAYKRTAKVMDADWKKVKQENKRLRILLEEWLQLGTVDPKGYGETLVERTKAALKDG